MFCVCGAGIYQRIYILGTNKFSFAYYFYRCISVIAFAAEKTIYGMRGQALRKCLSNFFVRTWSCSFSMIGGIRFPIL